MGKSKKKKAKSKETSGAGKESQEITVYIYESEYRQIQVWVAKYQNLETGGDLFGLWTDDHTAVVQLVLGPGEHCTRTSTSFYQDVEYLDRVGNLLTNNEGLCHIGEWHSHHRLGLKEPSGGDKNTVWNNMDRYGIRRFCLFIATIDGSGSTPDDVSVNGFHFMTTIDKRRRLFECKFVRLSEKSPFRLKYYDVINEGVESVNEIEMKGKEADNVPVEGCEVNGAESDALKTGERPDTGQPEGKKNLEYSCLTRLMYLILYVCSFLWLRCKKWCSVLGRCIHRCMWFLQEKETEDAKATEPVKHQWTFSDVIRLCCPICWFIPKHQEVKI